MMLLSSWHGLHGSLNTKAQHIIFEAVGQLVNSLNYIHYMFTFELTSIDEQQAKFAKALYNMSNSMKPLQIPNSHNEPELTKLIWANYNQAMAIFILYKRKVRILLNGWHPFDLLYQLYLLLLITLLIVTVPMTRESLQSSPVFPMKFDPFPF